MNSLVYMYFPVLIPKVFCPNSVWAADHYHYQYQCEAGRDSFHEFIKLGK